MRTRLPPASSFKASRLQRENHFLYSRVSVARVPLVINVYRGTISPSSTSALIFLSPPDSYKDSSFMYRTADDINECFLRGKTVVVNRYGCVKRYLPKSVIVRDIYSTHQIRTTPALTGNNERVPRESENTVSTIPLSH